MAASKEAIPVPEVVKLSQAKVLGQLVKGSGQSSRYVCVVVGKHLNMAGRVNGASLSVRVEPWEGKESALNAAAVKLTALGFTVHQNGYASAHMSAESSEKAIMGLAAFMMGMLCVAPGVSLPLDALRETLAKGV